MKDQYDVIIVGAGMAGLAAAEVLTGTGIATLVVDENPHAGGQLLRRIEGRKKWSPDAMKPKGFALAQIIKEAAADPGSNLDLISQAQVLGIFQEHQVQILFQGKVREVRAEYILLATGARERYLPFKGWTLPGVMSLGAAQILMKSSGILPARETLIAGTSPLQMALAGEILSNGGKVRAILDENPAQENFQFLPLARRHWAKALEGGWYTARLAAARVPHRHRTRIKEALGETELEAVVTVKTDRKGRAVPGSEETIETKALAVGYGFVPNVELAVQAGCRLIHDAARGGWIMETDEDLTASQTHILAAGEVTGVAGVKKSWVEGRLAGLTLKDRLGKVPTGQRGELEKERRQLKAERSHQEAYGRFLNRLCRLPRAAYEEINDAAVICRCEGVTMATLKQRVAQGFDTPTALKRSSRTGMGRCQGRICGPVIQEVLAALNPGVPIAGAKPALRSPVKNTPIAAYLED